MKTSIRIAAWLLTLTIAWSLAACAVGGKKADDKNTIDWNGDFYGTTLPAVDGHDKVCEYTVKDDSITVRIDGVSYEEFTAYCRKLEALDGWQVHNDEDTAHFPADYNERDKVYFTGIYQNLPHIAVQYYSDKQCESSGYPHFVLFVFKEW